MVVRLPGGCHRVNGPRRPIGSNAGSPNSPWEGEEGHHNSAGKGDPLASLRPRDLVGKTRRRLAAEQLAELVAVEKKVKALSKELKALVEDSVNLDGSARCRADRCRRILADAGEVTRFAGLLLRAGHTPLGHAPPRHPADTQTEIERHLGTGGQPKESGPPGAWTESGLTPVLLGIV